MGMDDQYEKLRSELRKNPSLAQETLQTDGKNLADRGDLSADEIEELVYETRMFVAQQQRHAPFEDLSPASESPDESPAHKTHNELAEVTILFEASQPEIYQNNPFRVAEVAIDATARDLSRRQQMVEMAGKTGIPIPPGSGRALPLNHVVDPTRVRNALQQLRDPEARLVSEFFWFWPHEMGQSARDDALRALAENQIVRAQAIWESEEQRRDSNVALHNLTVLAHVAALDQELQASSAERQEFREQDRTWDEAFRRWQALLDHEGFWSRLTARVRDLNDPRLTTGVVRRLRDGLPLALLLINANLALRAAERGDTNGAKRQLHLMQTSGFDPALIDRALQRTIEPLRTRINLLCRNAEVEIRKEKIQGYTIAYQLIEDVKKPLKVLDTLLPPAHHTLVGIHDDIANRALNCTVNYVNETKDWETALSLVDTLAGLASGKVTRERLNEGRKTLTRNLDNERKFNRCWFCEQNGPVAAHAVDVDMHRITNRVYTFRGYQIRWNTVKVKVPRCAECKEAHDRASNVPVIWAMLGTIPGGILGYMIHPGFWAVLIGAFLAFMIIGVATTASEEARLRSRDIKPLSTQVEFYGVKEFKEQGWSMGSQPPEARKSGSS